MPKKENFPVLRPEKDRTDPEILCSDTPIVMGNFNGNVLAQKKVYFTVPPFVRSDSDRTSPDPANSGGPCRTVRWTSDGLRWIPPCSATSPVKVWSSGLMAKNGRTGWTCQSIGLPPDFHWTYKQKRQTRKYFLLSQYFQGPLGIIRVLLFLETT